MVEGNVLISTSILGPLAAASELVSLENIRLAIRQEVQGCGFGENLAAPGTRIQKYEDSQVQSFPAASARA